MQTWIVWATTAVDDEMLRDFALQRGGYWNDVIGGEAVIPRGDVSIFVAAASANDDRNVVPEDVARATYHLKQPPLSAISIWFRSSERALREAEAIALTMVEQWGGFLDRNEPPG